MHEALCRSSGTTLDIGMSKDGPPITQRTSGLEHGGMRAAAMRPCHPDAVKLAKRVSRRWRVVLLRAKGEILGTVEAPDAQADKAAAAVQFELGDVQQGRIIVQELR